MFEAAERRRGKELEKACKIGKTKGFYRINRNKFHDVARRLMPPCCIPIWQITYVEFDEYLPASARYICERGRSVVMGRGGQALSRCACRSSGMRTGTLPPCAGKGALRTGKYPYPYFQSLPY